MTWPLKTSFGTNIDKSPERRALSESKPLAPWPPKIGDRVHFNSGHAHTSWTAEVRSETVDDTVVVLWQTVPVNGYSGWSLCSRTEWEVHRVRSGPLPKGLCR